MRRARLPPLNVDAQHVVALDTGTAQRRAALLRCVSPIARRRDLHHPADRLDTLGMAVPVDECPQHLKWRTQLTDASQTGFSYGRRELTMSTDTTATPREDAIDLLTRDHRIVTDLFKEFSKEQGPSQLELVQSICTKLTIHAAIEEELFYPAVRQVVNADDLLNEAEVEHGTAKYLIRQLLAMNKDDGHFCAKVKVLRDRR
jgi:hypothetical protein